MKTARAEEERGGYTVEVRTATLGPGRRVAGVWEPAGQLIAHLRVDGPRRLAEEVARRLSAPWDEGEEAWAAEVTE